MTEEQKDNNRDEQAGNDVELITLTEVSERTGISMPTLQRYKKEFQHRLPSVGEGRTQKYRADSLEVFEQIKRENIKKRGRPKKSRKKKKDKESDDGRSDLLTLTEVGERTGISYPTLVRYVKLHGDKIPFEGEGRRRRYHPEAVEVFQEIRSQSGRGRRKKKAGAGAGAGAGASPDLARRVKALEKSQERLETQIKDLLKELRKPLQVTLRRG